MSTPSSLYASPLIRNDSVFTTWNESLRLSQNLPDFSGQLLHGEEGVLMMWRSHAVRSIIHSELLSDNQNIPDILQDFHGFQNPWSKVSIAGSITSAVGRLVVCRSLSSNAMAPSLHKQDVKSLFSERRTSRGNIFSWRNAVSLHRRCVFCCL